MTSGDVTVMLFTESQFDKRGISLDMGGIIKCMIKKEGLKLRIY